MKSKKFILFICCCLILFAENSFSEETSKRILFTILHTSDTHGEFYENDKNQYGFARLKAYADQVRKEVEGKGGILLVLSSGDTNTGYPRSDLLKGAPDIEAMNAIPYDAMTVGNHEFDLTQNDLLQQEKWAAFPFLASNVFWKKTGKRVFSPFLEKKIKGLKIAILGLTTEETEGQPKTENYKFIPVLESAKDVMGELRKRNNVVIGLTHIGYYLKGKHSPRSPGDITLARNVPGFDIILGGHTHTKLKAAYQENGIVFSHSGDRLHHVNRLDFVYEGGKLKFLNYHMQSLKNLPEDKELKKVLTLYYKKGGRELEKIVGTIDHDFYGRTRGLKKETNLGRLIARAQNDLLKTDVGVMSDRGIRTDLKKGKLSYEDILKVLPFHNTLCSVEMTGPELKGYLEKAPDVIHLDGVKVYFNGKKIIRMVIRGKDVILDEKNPQAKNILYKVSINQHNALGGSSWPDLSKNKSFVDSGYDHAFVLKSYIEKKKEIFNRDFQEENIIKK